MDVWSLVADYLLERNPLCTAPAGTLLACVSRTHKAAVEMAVRRACYPPCGRPIKLTINGELLRFCMACPGEFEVPALTYRHDLFRAFSPCMLTKPMDRGRMTHSLVVHMDGRCVGCGCQFTRTPADPVVMVALFIHYKTCPGCMEEMPQMCLHCRKAFAY